MLYLSQEPVPLFLGGLPILPDIEKRNVYRKGVTKEALLRALLDAVFGTHVLAHGNACGARVAFNKGEGEGEGENKALDREKLNQIKGNALKITSQ